MYKIKDSGDFAYNLQNRLFQALAAKMALGVEFALKVAPVSLLRFPGGYVGG